MGPIKIENVIVASHLAKEVELIKLATELPNARYSSSGNPSVIVELDRTNPKFIGSKRLKAAGIVFGNGKIIITGIASLEEGKEIMNNLKEMIKNVDAKINMKRATKVENMVTTANLNQNLDLQNLSAKIPGSEYDPARFQGLIIRTNKPLASYILFETGVTIITDIISLAKAKKAHNELIKFMTQAKVIS